MKEAIGINQELSKKLNDYMGRIEQFASEQLPDFAQEYIQYLMVRDVYSPAMGAAVAFILLLLGLYCTWLGSGNYDSEGFRRRVSMSDSDYLFQFCGMLLSIICFTLLIIGASKAVGSYMEISSAPKVYLIEHLRK